jgi:hypothetical protein
MNLIHSFLIQKKINRQYQRFHTGYNYAAGALLRGEKTPLQLENEQTTDYDEFDKGVDSAIKQAIKLKICADDRI